MVQAPDGVGVARAPFVRHDAWLSAVLERPAFQLTSSTPEAIEVLEAHASRQAGAFYFTKVAVGDVAAVAALTSAGMSVVDVNVLLAVDAAAVRARPRYQSAVVVRDADAADRAAVLDIAASAFRYSRFHLDPAIPKPLADRTRRMWIESYFDGARGERLLVADGDGVPAGFLAVVGGEADGGDGARVRHKTIDLIAVTAASRRAGIGRALVEFFLREYAVTCDELRVGTQIANTPSIRLYERAGMTFRDAQYVLHMHTAETA